MVTGESDPAAVAWAMPEPPKDREALPVDPDAHALCAVLSSLISLGAATSRRSTQVALGSSEAGHQCDRRIAYKLQQVPAGNLRDPLRAFVGTGYHLGAAELFQRLDGGSGRFLVESHVEYRGIPGTADLYDRFLHTLVDWKSTTLKKLKQIRYDGPAMPYIVQAHLYGAGLIARGEDVRAVALAFVPVDGDLSDMWVWRVPFSQRVADEAIERIERLRNVRPQDAHHRPDRLCSWCAHYLRGSTDLAVGCPGE